jgi:hypothetical protein
MILISSSAVVTSEEHVFPIKEKCTQEGKKGVYL